jgi:hypothetical protein
MPAFVDSTFQGCMDNLRDYAEAAAVSASPEGVRMWAHADDNDVSVSPWSDAHIRAAYSRSGVNAMYETALLDNGSLGDCAAVQLQGNHLSAVERAYRLRRAGRVRLAAWRAARQLGHASDGGPLYRLSATVQNFVASGTDPQGRAVPPSASAVAAAEAAADTVNRNIAQATSNSSFASPFYGGTT